MNNDLVAGSRDDMDSVVEQDMVVLYHPGNMHLDLAIFDLTHRKKRSSVAGFDVD